MARRRVASGRERETLAALAREPRSCSDSGEGSGDPRLWDAWERLSVADREVLALMAWEELSVAKAADVFGCSGPVFSVRLHRARRRLQRLLARERSVSGIEPVEA